MHNRGIDLFITCSLRSLLKFSFSKLIGIKVYASQLPLSISKVKGAESEIFYRFHCSIPFTFNDRYNAGNVLSGEVFDVMDICKDY